MSKKSSTQTMDDPSEVMERALSKKAGISIMFVSSQHASDYRQRCYSIRQNERDQAKRNYQPGTPEHGVSRFDSLVFQISKGQSDVLHIVQASAEAFGIVAIKDTATGRKISVTG